MREFSLRRSLKVRQFVENMAQYVSLEKCHEIKPFSCKLCSKLFVQVGEVKEHIKVQNFISEVKEQVKSLKTQVTELEVKLKISQKN